jgi:hypothetical protein
MVWYTTFDSVFWITLAGIITGSVGLCVRYSLKSKCDLVKICWGMLEIHRNVGLEANSNEVELSSEENKI